MPLIQFWKSEPADVLKMTIKQIVSTAGDGQLLDGSECSKELRAFLAEVDIGHLAAYAEHCLEEAFNRSGMVLQDIANELGRRLDYTVANGLYQGTVGSIGNDGLWHSAEGNDVLIEVKTTDAYRVRLDKIAAYRDKLREAGQISKENSVLLIVGREDTGELEAQVRGSRHAWDMRIISVEALIRLVELKQATDVPETGKKIRSLLVPREYTRLDAMIDVIFSTAADVEADVEELADPGPSPDPSATGAGGWLVTDSNTLNAKRASIVSSFAALQSTPLVKKTKALYWSSDHDLRVACSISKRYLSQGTERYWYAYHPRWDEFLSGSSKSFFILGCVDLNIAFAVPLEVLHSLLKDLNTTTPKNGATYWHVKIIEPLPDKYFLHVPKTGKHYSLNQHMFKDA